VFDLYFPVVDAEITEPAPTNAELLRGTELILFVDDDEMLASLGEKLLTQMGYQVSVMTDSTEALKLFATNADRFDLVVTDQTMPNLTGKDLSQEIKKIRSDIPTILCTGYSSKVDEEIAKELEISAFLMKPLDLSELAQTVRRVLDGETEE
jgi:DNA-binding NtrC family response regulator